MDLYFLHNTYFQIVSRKGKCEEKKPLLVLFNAQSIGAITAAASNAVNQQLTEQNHSFLKKLTLV